MEFDWEVAPDWATQVCMDDLGLHHLWSDGGTKYSYVNHVVKDTFEHDLAYNRNYDDFVIVEYRHSTGECNEPHLKYLN